MKKIPKIIYINQRSYGRFFPEEGTDYFYLFGVGHFLAEQILDNCDGLLLENWRCDKTLRRKMSKSVKGINCRIFPSFYSKRFGELSFSLLNDLSKEMKDNYVVLHLMGLHTNLCSLIAWLFRKYPIVGTHLGGANFRFKYDKTRKARSLVRDKIEKRILRYYDHILVQTETERDYLLNSLGAKSISRASIYGLDFDIFRRRDKYSSRKTLNWPLDKKIILSVGRAYHNKGIGFVLDAFSKLKDEGILLCMVSIHPSDPLYSEVVRSGASFAGDVDYFRLPLYYSAADLLIYLPFDDESLHFAGPGYVNIESLACGTPVVSTLLRHFPDPDINKVSRVPYKQEDVVPMVKELLNNPPSPMDCRQIAFKYYNWYTILGHHTEIYENLFQRYYDCKVTFGTK